MPWFWYHRGLLKPNSSWRRCLQRIQVPDSVCFSISFPPQDGSVTANKRTSGEVRAETQKFSGLKNIHSWLPERGKSLNKDSTIFLSLFCCFLLCRSGFLHIFCSIWRLVKWKCISRKCYMTIYSTEVTVLPLQGSCNWPVPVLPLWISCWPYPDCLVGQDTMC